MIRTILLGLLAIMLLSAGQTSIKTGLNDIGGVSRLMSSASSNSSDPWVIVGFACYGLSSVLWLDVLSKLDFSLAFLMVAVTYVFTLLTGRFFFQETISWDRVLGVSLIIFGVFFLARSGLWG